MNTIGIFVTVTLAAITAWYAYSTSKMLQEMRKQSILLVKTAQVAINTALINAAAHPSGENPFDELRKLREELKTEQDSA